VNLSAALSWAPFEQGRNLSIAHVDADEKQKSLHHVLTNFFLRIAQQQSVLAEQQHD